MSVRNYSTTPKTSGAGLALLEKSCVVHVVEELVFPFFVMHNNAFWVVFFFSSRRRHTRSYGDWSSDVCSSDLSEASQQAGPGDMQGWRLASGRSEERRVGKECRSGWWPNHEKKKERDRGR